MVIGADDIVNPARTTIRRARSTGMPVLEVWKARTSTVMKRSMASGYTREVDNPLFYKDNKPHALRRREDNARRGAGGVEELNRPTIAKAPPAAA